MTQLSTLDLQKKILAYYMEHTEVVRGMDDFGEAQKYLHAKQLYRGICHTSHHVFRVDIFMKHWVHVKSIRNRAYWCDCPCDCFTLKKILAALTTRIDILKSIIAESEQNNQTNL